MTNNRRLRGVGLLTVTAGIAALTVSLARAEAGAPSDDASAAPKKPAAFAGSQTATLDLASVTAKTVQVTMRKPSVSPE